MVFDYGQKIALLDLETDKKHEESIQQIAEKK